MSLENNGSWSARLHQKLEHPQDKLSEQQLLDARLRGNLQELHDHQRELPSQNENLLAAQSELTKAHQKYLDLFDQAPIGYFSLDDDGIIREVNIAAARLLGRSRRSMLGKPLWIYIDKPDRDFFHAQLRKSRSLGSLSFETAFLRHPTEQTVAVELHCVMVDDLNGEPKFCRIAALDISRRKTAERALRIADQWLDSILSTIPDIVYRLDVDGTITYISPTVREYGYEPEELVGQHFLKLVHPDDRASAEQRMAEQRSGGRPSREFEIRLLTRPRSLETEAQRCFAINSSVIYHTPPEGGRCFAGIQGVARDISMRKRREQERRQLKMRLVRAQRLEAVGTLVGGIAHDFNEIMTGIQGSASLLQMLYPEPGKIGDTLKIIDMCISRGRDLTRQLLGFAGGGKHAANPVDMNRILTSCLNVFNSTQKSIEMECALEHGLWCVLADEAQMEQVFLNLFVNAAQAMPEGGDLLIASRNVILDLQTAKPCGLEKGNYVEIRITDSGVGMDESTVGQIFEPFFSTKSSGGGAGLGLASAYGIIRSHGGVILVESELRKGTTFTILLPAQPANVLATDTNSASVVNTGQRTILVVDDEDIAAEVVSKMLAGLQYKVITVRSGAESLNVYSANPNLFDLVVLDVLMPVMNGLETYSRLKLINPLIRVVFCSGYRPGVEIEQIARADGQQILLKPFNLSELSGAVEAGLRQRPPAS